MRKTIFVLLAAFMMLPMIANAQSGCDLTVKMTGMLGDSWDGAAVKCYVNGSLEFEASLYEDGLTLDSVTYELAEDDAVQIVWMAGKHPSQCGFTIKTGETVIVSTTNAVNSFVDGQTVAEFEGCPSCPTPVGLRASYFTAHSATLTWAGEEGATYSVSYCTDGTATTTSATATTNSVTLTGLDSLTVYRAKVRKVCSNTDMSDFSDEILFVTPSVAGGFATVNYDATMTDTTSTVTQIAGAPLGQLLMGPSFTQTLVDSAYLAGLNGREITHFGFNVIKDDGGENLEGVSVYMANVPETVMTSYISPNANHVFHLVIGNGDLCYSSLGWKLHQLDSTFLWDGHSSVLVTVINNTEDVWDLTDDYNIHKTNGAKTYNASSIWVEWALDCLGAETGATYGFSGDLMFLSTLTAATCPTPEAVFPTNVTYNSAVMTWSGDAAEFQLHYTNGSNDNWSDPVIISDSSYLLADLTEMTNYIFEIRSVCIDDSGDTTFSEWVGVAFSTPNLPCDAPTGLTPNEITFSTVTFNWTENGAADIWNLHVWNTLFDTIFNTTAIPFTVSGLTPNTEYYAAVNAQCSEESNSIYSDTLFFKTIICPTVTSLNVTNLTSNSVTLEWSGAGEGFDIEYGDLHFSEGVNTTVVHTTNNTYTITGLQPEYDYSASVRAECEEGAFSSYCAQVDFTTLAGSEGVETAGAANVTIYPNPTSDAATISISGVTGTVEVNLVDLNGRVVHTEQLECSGSCVKQLQVSGLTKGAYLVRLKGNGLDTVSKLIIE